MFFELFGGHVGNAVCSRPELMARGTEREPGPCNYLLFSDNAGPTLYPCNAECEPLRVTELLVFDDASAVLRLVAPRSVSLACPPVTSLSGSGNRWLVRGCLSRNFLGQFLSRYDLLF
jgi:hypothetical protein